MADQSHPPVSFHHYAQLLGHRPPFWAEFLYESLLSKYGWQLRG